MFEVSTVEPRTWPHSRGRSQHTWDVSAAGLGFPAFCERLKKLNTSISARMPHQMLLPPETEGRAARPVPPSHEGGGWAAGTRPDHAQGRQHRPARAGARGTGLGHE